MKTYLDLLRETYEFGEKTANRTSVPTRSLTGRSLRWDLREGFPILTTRRISFRIAFEETLFFLRGETQTKLLEEKKIGIWRDNTSREFLDERGLGHIEAGDMGKGYGYQIRNFG